MRRPLAVALAAAILAGAVPGARAGDAPRDCDGPAGWHRAACDAVALGRAATLRERDDRIRAIVVLSAAAALYAVRHDIRDEIREHRTPSRTRFFERGRELGKGAAAPLFAAGFLVAWGVSGNREHAGTAQLLLESMAASALASGIGSFVLAAERPEDGSRVRPFRTGGHGVSLDVALAASTAGVLAFRPLRAGPGDARAKRFWKGTGRAALHAAVLLTALQRMDADKHWAPDVVLGAGAGYGVAGALVRAREPEAVASRAAPLVVPARGGGALVWDLSRPR